MYFCIVLYSLKRAVQRIIACIFQSQEMALSSLPNHGPVKFLLCWWLYLGPLNCFCYLNCELISDLNLSILGQDTSHKNFFLNLWNMTAGSPKEMEFWPLETGQPASQSLFSWMEEKVTWPPSLSVQTVYLLRQLPCTRMPLLSSSLPAWMQKNFMAHLVCEALLDHLLT